jgi:hypothetical protein
MTRKALVMLASVACLMLVLLCTVKVYAENYAVLITGDTPSLGGSGEKTWGLDSSRITYDEFWNDTYLMWEALYTLGWKDENIFVLYGEGADYDSVAGQNPRYIVSSSPYGLSHITDYSATYDTVQYVFHNLASVMTEGDFLFVWVFDHGDHNYENGHSFFQVMDSCVYDTEFSAMLDSCGYAQRVIFLQQCFSGGFIHELQNHDTYIMTSVLQGIAGQADSHPDGTDSLENEIWNGNVYTHGEMDYHMINALRLRTIIGNPLKVPDQNQDDLASLKEIWRWVDSTSVRPNAFPQSWISGNPANTIFLNIRPYKPTGFSGTCVQNHTELSWNSNSEYDLAHYNLYKKTYCDSSQTYSAWHLLAQCNASAQSYTDTTFFPSGAGQDTVWYKLAAVDSVGQLSEFTDAISSPGVILTQSLSGQMAFLAPNNIFIFKHYPEPFNLETTIQFTLREAGLVTLSVYNTAGRKVKELVKGLQTSGTHEVRFTGNAFPSGVYFCRLQIGAESYTTKLVLLK